MSLFVLCHSEVVSSYYSGISKHQVGVPSGASGILSAYLVARKLEGVSGFLYSFSIRMGLLFKIFLASELVLYSRNPATFQNDVCSLFFVSCLVKSRAKSNTDLKLLLISEI